MQYRNNLRTRPRGHCDRCARYICDQCDGAKNIIGCTYFEEMIDLALAHPGQGPFLNHEPGKIEKHVIDLRDSHRIIGVGANYTKKDEITSEKELGVVDNNIKDKSEGFEEI